MNINAFWLAQRFVGLKEVSGPASNPAILAMLRLDGAAVADDSTPWCSAWVNYIAWLLRLPRSKSLAARSWLGVGKPVEIRDADPMWDVVILTRGEGEQPGPDVLNAAGHVGFFAGLEYDERDTPKNVLVLGGNQHDSVSVASFPASRVLGIRRLVG